MKRREPFYGSARWLRFRRWYLSSHPFCVQCPAAATEVDHLKPVRERPDLALVEDNVRALCKPCHSRRTARDSGFSSGGAG